jgi:hypothetical protein
MTIETADPSQTPFPHIYLFLLPPEFADPSIWDSEWM